MGMTLDGSENVNCFRNTISSGGIPSKSSITCEGLFSTYFFKVKELQTKELVAPTFSCGKAPPPLDDLLNNEKKSKDDKYITVELHSCDDGKNERNDLNVCIVLDISGSMRSSFGYSPTGINDNPYEKIEKTKMEVANECVCSLIDDLKEEEFLSIILFDTETQVFQEVVSVKDLKKEVIKEMIMEIKSRGGTNMELGYSKAMEVLEKGFKNFPDSRKRSNRVIFLTDAMPNSGGGENDLLGLFKKASKNNIYTTLIGIGLDLNTDLADAITKVQGANNFSVKNREEFTKILNEDFNYIVSPLAFETYVDIKSEKYKIAKVWGTAYSNENDGVSLKVGSVSASPVDKRGVKGSIILIKLEEDSKELEEDSIEVKLRYKNIKEEEMEFVSKFSLEEELKKIKEKIENKEEQKWVFENKGIHKSVLLSRYVEFIHKIIDKINNGITEFNDKKQKEFEELETDEEKKVFNERKIEYEKVDEETKEKIQEFKDFFKKQIELIGDESMEQELDVLNHFLFLK